MKSPPPCSPIVKGLDESISDSRREKCRFWHGVGNRGYCVGPFFERREGGEVGSVMSLCRHRPI